LVPRKRDGPTFRGSIQKRALSTKRGVAGADRMQRREKKGEGAALLTLSPMGGEGKKPIPKRDVRTIFHLGKEGKKSRIMEGEGGSFSIEKRKNGDQRSYPS